MPDAPIEPDFLGSSQNRIPPLPTKIGIQSVLKNTVLLIGFYVLTKLLALVSFVLLANYLGAEVFGVYNYSFALTALFIPLCDLGMDIYLMREVPRHSSEQISRRVGAVLIWKGLLTVLVFMAISITAAFLDSFGTVRFYLVVLAGVVTIFRNYWTTFGVVFRALDRVGYETSLSSLARVAEFLIVVFCIIAESSLSTLFLLLALINIIAVTSTYFIVKARFTRPTLQQDFGQMVEVLKGGLPFALTLIFTSVYFNIDTVFVSKFIGDGAAGIYRAAYNLILPLIMIVGAVSGAVFPFVSQNYKTTKDEVAKVIRESATQLLMIALPIAAIATMLSNEIIRFLFAPEYAPAAACLAILAWFLPIFYVSNLFSNSLGAMDHQMFVLKVTAFNMLFNVAANLLVIPTYAQLGAAVTTIATEVIGFFFIITKIRTIVPSPISFTMVGKILFSCGVTVAFLLLKLDLHVIILLCLSFTLYVGTLFLVRGITISEIRRIFQAFKNTAPESGEKLHL